MVRQWYGTTKAFHPSSTILAKYAEGLLKAFLDACEIFISKPIEQVNVSSYRSHILCFFFCTISLTCIPDKGIVLQEILLKPIGHHYHCYDFFYVSLCFLQIWEAFVVILTAISFSYNSMHVNFSSRPNRITKRWFEVFSNVHTPFFVYSTLEFWMNAGLVFQLCIVIWLHRIQWSYFDFEMNDTIHYLTFTNPTLLNKSKPINLTVILAYISPLFAEKGIFLVGSMFFCS